MKGKSKLITMLFAVVTMVASVFFVWGGGVKQIAYARAAEIEGFSAQYDPDVIFSVERVYMASGNDRSRPLSYNGYNFNAIDTANGVKYFGDYGLTSVGGYANKDVVRDGGFVKLNESVIYQASAMRESLGSSGYAQVKVSQGIMITFGGYFAKTINETTTINTNATIAWEDKDNDGEVDNDELSNGMLTADLPGWTDSNNNDKVEVGELNAEWKEVYITKKHSTTGKIWRDYNNNLIVDTGEVKKDGNLDSIATDDGWDDTNHDGVVNLNELDADVWNDEYYKVYTGQGANMTYVSVNATLNGQEVERPAPRTYLSEYQDWTWFIEAKPENEGHYELELSYMKDGVPYKASFNFYLLLESSYSKDVFVG